MFFLFVKPLNGYVDKQCHHCASKCIHRQRKWVKNQLWVNYPFNYFNQGFPLERKSNKIFYPVAGMRVTFNLLLGSGGTEPDHVRAANWFYSSTANVQDHRHDIHLHVPLLPHTWKHKAPSQRYREITDSARTHWQGGWGFICPGEYKKKGAHIRYSILNWIHFI